MLGSSRDAGSGRESGAPDRGASRPAAWAGTCCATALQQRGAACSATSCRRGRTRLRRTSTGGGAWWPPATPLREQRRTVRAALSAALLQYSPLTRRRAPAAETSPRSGSPRSNGRALKPSTKTNTNKKDGLKQDTPRRTRPVPQVRRQAAHARALSRRPPCLLGCRPLHARASLRKL